MTDNPLQADLLRCPVCGSPPHLRELTLNGTTVACLCSRLRVSWSGSAESGLTLRTATFTPGAGQPVQLGLRFPSLELMAMEGDWGGAGEASFRRVPESEREGIVATAVDNAVVAAVMKS